MKSTDLNVCLFPMEIVWEDKAKNIETIENIFQKIHPQTDLLILPETFTTGFPLTSDKEKVRVLAERNTGQTIDLIKSLASRYKLAIAGSFVADSGGSLYNRAFFIEPSGEDTFADKRHLFPLGGEDKVFSRGHDRLKIRYRGWNIAMTVCYDLRFPAWCRNRKNEYDAMLVVANWPESRVEIWDTLLKARAIENLAYVCGVNCTGTDPHGSLYNGSSGVYDFKGKDIAVSDPSSRLVYATLSRERLDTFREKFPVWKDADDFKLDLK